MSSTPQETARILLSIRQFADKHTAFDEKSLRNLIFRAEQNGIKKCLRRIGRRVLIDEAAFFSWIDEINADAA